jgi:mono/diheme cytochrome c family protein
MKLIKLFLVIITLTLFALACTSTNTNTGTQPTPAASPSAAASPSPVDEMAETREIYADECATCHRENGEGGPVKTDEKRINVPSFKKGHALSHTDEEFAKQIAVGGDGMPAFKDKLTPEQINLLVKYVRQQFQRGLVEPQQGRGRPLPAETPKH